MWFIVTKILARWSASCQSKSACVNIQTNYVLYSAFFSFSLKSSSFTYRIWTGTTTVNAVAVAIAIDADVLHEFPLLWLPTASNLIDNDFPKAIIYDKIYLHNLTIAFYFNFSSRGFCEFSHEFT